MKDNRRKSQLNAVISVNRKFSTTGLSQRAIALLICVFCACTAFAQCITGKVVNENNVPMAFVNVVLMTRADSTYITGTITKEDGSFLFENTHEKTGIVKFTSIGYVEQTRPIPSTGNLGTIRMSLDNVMLREVVVKANRLVTTVKGNALVTRVENSALAHAGTANDVLARVPMVFGRDGNFEVFGKGTPLIYVNGRKVLDLTELTHINSSDIKNVEVITNPGAKYDASVKSVVRIQTKRPQGEGWSGTLRTQNGIQHYFATRSQANLKYRTGGLEVFGNFGYLTGKFQNHTYNDMLVLDNRLIDQQIDSKGSMRNNEFYGKAGFSYLLGDKHSVGAYYSNGFSKQTENGGYASRITVGGILDDEISSTGKIKRDNYPRHYTNLYYNGLVGKLDIDFNVDYMWNKKRTNMVNDETGIVSGSTLVNSSSANHECMFAQKLSLSYPVWKGEVEIGEEYTSSRFENVYNTDAVLVGDAASQVRENNIASFIQMMQRLGKVEIAAGLRYEHVDFSYMENGQVRPDQDKRYDNLFPSLSVSTMIKKVQLAFSYTNKTQRPSYADLDGTIDYINRFTLEGGNPYLKPEKIHTVELMGAWQQLFAQVSFTYNKNPLLNTTVPYDEGGEVKLITKDNLPSIKKLEVFVGSHFQFGFWQPKLNVGLLKQWFAIDYTDGCKRLDNPILLAQWQNAIHLPADIWLNMDMQWMSSGNEDNMRIKPTSYVNVKFYKPFFNNRFSVSFEAKDIFNKSGRKLTLYNKDVTLFQINKTDNRLFQLTLQYNFNITRDRYRGNGAGQAEKNRF